MLTLLNQCWNKCPTGRIISLLFTPPGSFQSNFLFQIIHSIRGFHWNFHSLVLSTYLLRISNSVLHAITTSQHSRKPDNFLDWDPGLGCDSVLGISFAPVQAIYKVSWSRAHSSFLGLMPLAGSSIWSSQSTEWEPGRCRLESQESATSSVTGALG